MTHRIPLFAAGLAAMCAIGAPSLAADRAVTLGETTFVAKGLVAAGRMPANLRDSFGETFGSGSGMAVDSRSWKRTGDGMEGDVLLLPDRGYNVEGTTDYRARINRLSVKLTPVAPGVVPPADLRQAGIRATLSATTLLTDAAGQSMTGLDPVKSRPASGRLPALPLAATDKISIDPEAVVHLPDGSMFISDEYGPYIYRFSAEGKLLGAIRPPEAFIPMRKGEQDFSSNNPGPGGAEPSPKNPETGRQNNQGFEGMTMTPDGKSLVVILQSATRQDGGDSPATRNHTRALVYDIANPDEPKLVREHVVPLPVFQAGGKTLVAAQSEILAIGSDKFLLLSRDSNNGFGVKGDTSLYRRIDILDLSKATNIAGSAFDGAKPVAPKGVLDPSVTPATLTGFIDLNDNGELNRFGLRNGAPNDRDNLSEKWEAMGLVPVQDPSAPDDYFLLVVNDNDFLTKEGFQVGAAYKADADVDTLLLAYRVTLPGLAAR